MNEQFLKSSIEELKNKIGLKEKEYNQALKEKLAFEASAKIFSEKRKLEEKLKTIELIAAQHNQIDKDHNSA